MNSDLLGYAMRRHAISIILTIILSLLLAGNLPAKQRGIRVTAKTPSGKEIPLYSNSYAFVVGNGTYTNGWDPLPGAIRDVKDVARALKENGFNVVLKTDLTRNEFNQAFGRFCYKFGRAKANRLLFYYAGHGHTQKMFTNENLGYLVMVDAPVPEKDPMGFRFSSVDMQAIVTEAKMIKARHVLFMFDSCFSGSILNLRERVVPETISDSVSLPVRQFITAGRANEPVPDHSIFKQAFLDLLEGRDKEPIPDGYITGEELGLYLKNKVPEYSPTQHPQYGKIKDVRLDKGDFVFALRIPSTPQPPTVGQSSSIKDYDKIIEERKANKKKWDSWQKRMETDLSKVERYDKSSALNAEEKAEAWEGLLVSYSADNPYTVRDNNFRKKAKEQNRYWKEFKESGKLFVDTRPSSVTIKILNIGPKFYQGMELRPGRYHVETSKQGYKTQKKWVDLKAGENKRLEVRLDRLQASVQRTSTDARSPSSKRSPIVDEWMKDPQFVVLPIQRKRNILSNFFDSEVTDDEFYTLDAETQAQIKENFLRVHLGFDKPEKPAQAFGDTPNHVAEIVQPAPPPPSSSSNVIKRDGIYVAYVNGIVRDMKTGLEWIAGPDRNTDWNKARSWVKSLNLDGGGWRMPTTDELKTLYKKGAGDSNMTPLLKTTGLGVWSSETKGSSDARFFNFYYGVRFWFDRYDSGRRMRAFAVRSRRGG